MFRLAALLVLLAGCGSSGLPTRACDYSGPSRGAECPADWTAARAKCSGSNTSCTQTGLQCWYPGAGDAVTDSKGACWATALLGCYAVDAGVGEWRCAQ